jgi:hypothetical protein
LDPYNFLVSPKITISGSNPKLEWNIGSYHARYCEEHYKVVVSTTKFTDANCESVGEVVFEETLTTAEGATLKNRSVNMSKYNGQDVYIAWVHYDCSDEYSIMLTDIRISSSEHPAPVSAPLMGGLTVGDVSPASASVSATISNEGGVTVVKRGFCYSLNPNPTINDLVVASSVTSASVLNSFSAELTVEGGKTYHIRAYAENAVGITYSSEQVVTTPATVQTIHFFENFATNPFTASGSEWVLIDKDGDGYNWTYFADEDDQCARSRSWQSGVGALTPENYMVLPPIALPGGAKTAELSFKVAASGRNDYEESYEVSLCISPVNIDNCRNGSVIKPLETLTSANSYWTFTGRKVDLTPYLGQTVYIIFVHKDSSDEESLLITDIEVASYK